MKLLKSYIHMLSYALISIMLVACTHDDSEFTDGPALSVRLQLGQPARVTQNGVDSLNENSVSAIDVFLFHADADENTAAIFSGSASANSITFDNGEKTASINLNIPLSKYKLLFPNNETTCQAYFIVNRPSDCALPALANSTLVALKHLVVGSSQFQVIDNTTKQGKNILTKQPLFVMDGYSDNIVCVEMLLSGTVPVERAAVKIQLQLDEITNNISANGTTWSADKSNIRITLQNGCNRSFLNEETPSSYRKPDKNADLFRLEDISLDVNNSGTNFTTSYPMYTYPTYWGNDDAIRTYIVLVVDWINDADSSDKKTTYYEIPVNAGGNYLKRNTFYKIIQEVQIIGSETPEDPLQLCPSSYVILDWSDANTALENTETDAEISKLKYLVMEEPSVVMQNTIRKDLFYFSSDPIEIKNLFVQKMNVEGNVAMVDTIVGLNNLSSYYNSSTNTYTITAAELDKPLIMEIHVANPDVSNDHDYITLKHELLNNMDGDSDYTEYIFTFDVIHQGNDNYKESVKVEQYPMIAIKSDLNYDFGGDGDTNFNTKKGYVIINNNTSSTSWYGVYQNGLANDGANSNPNRYVISVSSLTTEGGKKYVIGDPRSKTNSVPTSINQDANRKSLQYYYPTQEDGTETMISPEFMVASSYGRCPNSISNIDDAVRRCATYQEDGYPAGRWRLATIAEIRYIVQLSGWGVIPSLFSDGIGYWSAHGCIQVNGGNVSDFTGGSGWGGGTRVVRCVYDTWYWGTEQGDRNKFVYGDKQR